MNAHFRKTNRRNRDVISFRNGGYLQNGCDAAKPAHIGTDGANVPGANNPKKSLS